MEIEAKVRPPTPNLSSPLSCLVSMGLIQEETPPGAADVCDLDLRTCISLLSSGDVGGIASDIWIDIRGASLAVPGSDRIDIFPDNRVSGPTGQALRAASVVFCRVSDVDGEGEDMRRRNRSMAAISIDDDAHVADVCIYDPTGFTDDVSMASMADSVGRWMRVVLGEGWGLRVEVFTGTRGDDLRRLWLSIMVILKPYLPHVRMMDTWAALRLECTCRRVSVTELTAALVDGISGWARRRRSIK
jgi:hypothetical protein